MTRYTKLSVITAAAVSTSCATTLYAQADGYMTNQMVQSAIQELASTNNHAWATTIGTSLQGRPISLITLAGDEETEGVSNRPALLITAGIDGRSLVSTEVAIRLAENVLKDHPGLLDSMTIYIIPRVNPDGAMRNMNPLTMGYSGNARATDDDRDRAVNEDAAEDLNNDGLITMMRRLNPPIEDPATHLADPDDPRLNIEPDSKEDQRASFTLYTEGIDNDLDGLINEDGFGSVDLDSNFMHRWPEYGTHAGRYPLSEPESLALAQFVLSHDNIIMALTLGKHDNLINQPDSKSKDITGTAPKAIDADDAEMYKSVGELYKKITGSNSASKEDIAGSFHAWLYAQRGIPSFAAVVWTRPEAESNKDEESTENKDAQEQPDDSGLTPSGIGDISQETIEELMAAYEAETDEKVDDSMIAMVTPEMIEGFAAQAGVEIRRISTDEPSSDEPSEKAEEKPKKKSKSEDAKWLVYFDENEIQGFVDWQPFDHPTLGQVEIGGFVPLSKINPPSDQIHGLSTKLTSFVVDLIEMRPEIDILGPEIKQLSDGLYEVRISLVNEGRLPTSTAFSRTKRTVRPMIIRLSSEVESIVTGQRITRVWGIDAHGARSDHRWILRTNNIDSETITVLDPRFGNQTIQLGH